MLNFKNILGIRIDELDTSLEEALDTIIGNENNLIVPIDVPLLLKIRRNSKLRDIVNSASLVIPIDKSLSKNYNINEFNLYSKMLTYFDSKNMSLFIFGTKKLYAIKIFDMLKRIYPNIVNVGFYEYSTYKKSNEKDSIFEGIRKIAPDVISLQTKFSQSITWFEENKSILKTNIYIPPSKSFDVFSGKKKSPPYKVIQKNSRSYYFARNPLLLLTYAHFYILNFFYKLKNK